jgi:hypothetical protein
MMSWSTTQISYGGQQKMSCNRAPLIDRNRVHCNGCQFSALVNRWTASVSTGRTRKVKRETVDVHVENFPLHEQRGSVS